MNFHSHCFPLRLKLQILRLCANPLLTTNLLVFHFVPLPSPVFPHFLSSHSIVTSSAICPSFMWRACVRACSSTRYTTVHLCERVACASPLPLPTPTPHPRNPSASHLWRPQQSRKQSPPLSGSQQPMGGLVWDYLGTWVAGGPVSTTNLTLLVTGAEKEGGGSGRPVDKLSRSHVEKIFESFFLLEWLWLDGQVWPQQSPPVGSRGWKTLQRLLLETKQSFLACYELFHWNWNVWQR